MYADGSEVEFSVCFPSFWNNFLFVAKFGKNIA
jgi:hypothetical protein